VYVRNADTRKISILELKSNGDLTPVERQQAGPRQEPHLDALSVSPGRKRLYSGNLRNEPYSAGTFAIDAKTGKLKPPAPAAGHFLAYLATDRGGKFLLVASLWRQQGGRSPRSGRTHMQAVAARSSRRSRTRIDSDHPTIAYVLHTSLGGDLVLPGEVRRQDRSSPQRAAECSIKTKAGSGICCFRRTGSSSIWSN